MVVGSPLRWRRGGRQTSFFAFCEDVTKRSGPRLGPEVFDPHASRLRGARHHQHGCGDGAVVEFPRDSASGCQPSSDPELWCPGRITGPGPHQMAATFFDFGVEAFLDGCHEPTGYATRRLVAASKCPER